MQREGRGEHATSPESGCLESLRGFTKGLLPVPHQPTPHIHTFWLQGLLTNREYNKNIILSGGLWKFAKCDSVFLTTLLLMRVKLTLWTFTISDKTHVCRGGRMRQSHHNTLRRGKGSGTEKGHTGLRAQWNSSLCLTTTALIMNLTILYLRRVTSFKSVCFVCRARGVHTFSACSFQTGRPTQPPSPPSTALHFHRTVAAAS